jgi:hypothetical protein
MLIYTCCFEILSSSSKSPTHKSSLETSNTYCISKISRYLGTADACFPLSDVLYSSARSLLKFLHDADKLRVYIIACAINFISVECG